MYEVNLGMLILRVIVGLTLSAHGYAKLTKGARLEGLAGWFDSMGMRPGKVHAPLAAYTELLSGIGLALGVLTPFPALAMVAVMTVAGWTVHRKHFYILDEGFEYVMVIATVAVAVATVGPGKWSIDGALNIHDDLNGWIGLLISAGGGLAAAALHLGAFYRPEKVATS
ncbi:MAG: putative oxidoreductase [Acidimicrobiia bacterium]|jgi:putative oxidoreductase|nr:putative oxidoreductase [Acidimicrobiia bacterium]